MSSRRTLSKRSLEESGSFHGFDPIQADPISGFDITPTIPTQPTSTTTEASTTKGYDKLIDEVPFNLPSHYCLHPFFQSASESFDSKRDYSVFDVVYPFAHAYAPTDCLQVADDKKTIQSASENCGELYLQFEDYADAFLKRGSIKVSSFWHGSANNTHPYNAAFLRAGSLKLYPLKDLISQPDPVCLYGWCVLGQQPIKGPPKYFFTKPVDGMTMVMTKACTMASNSDRPFRQGVYEELNSRVCVSRVAAYGACKPMVMPSFFLLHLAGLIVHHRANTSSSFKSIERPCAPHKRTMPLSPVLNLALSDTSVTVTSGDNPYIHYCTTSVFTHAVSESIFVALFRDAFNHLISIVVSWFSMYWGFLLSTIGDLDSVLVTIVDAIGVLLQAVSRLMIELLLKFDKTLNITPSVVLFVISYAVLRDGYLATFAALAAMLLGGFMK